MIVGKWDNFKKYKDVKTENPPMFWRVKGQVKTCLKLNLG